MFAKNKIQPISCCLWCVNILTFVSFLVNMICFVLSVCGATGEKLSTSHSVAAQASGGILRSHCIQFTVVWFSASVAGVSYELAESDWDCSKPVGQKYEIQFVLVLSLQGIFYTPVQTEAVVDWIYIYISV